MPCRPGLDNLPLTGYKLTHYRNFRQHSYWADGGSCIRGMHPLQKLTTGRPMTGKRSDWQMSERDARRAAFSFIAQLLVLETGTAHPLFRLALHVADTGSRRVEKRFWRLAENLPSIILQSIDEAMERASLGLEVAAHRAECAYQRLRRGDPGAMSEAVVSRANAVSALAKFSQPMGC